MFPGSEIYGGLANSWDFGPYGVELKNNIKQSWWKNFVQNREDMVGLDSAIIMNPKVWEASGHLEHFDDYSIECKSCNNRFRIDQLDIDEEGNRKDIEKIKKATQLLEEGKREKSFSLIDSVNKKIQNTFNTKINCPNCKKRNWAEPGRFKLMMSVYLGALDSIEKSLHYLRPETAQGIFVNFKNILDTTRQKLPFGIAQTGKAFRNEITPGNFIFRTREFEQMEIEYFFNPEKTKWEEEFGRWLGDFKIWMDEIGIDPKKLFFHNIEKEELAHYSRKTVDVEFDFPFGRKELFGLAYRTDFDLKSHKLNYRDPETQKEIIPHVIEPSLGVERMALAAMLSAYTEEKVGDETRAVMKFKNDLAPIKVAIFPLLRNKPELVEKAKKIYDDLKIKFMCEFDDNGNIGKRYRRQDEIGTPYCVTVDFDTLNDNAVTVRDRDTMKQERVKINELEQYLAKKLT